MARYLIIPSNNDRLVYADLLEKLSILYGFPTETTLTLSVFKHYWVVAKTTVTIRMGFRGLSPYGGIQIIYESPEANEFNNL
jgi:hypothetical protein